MATGTASDHQEQRIAALEQHLATALRALGEELHGLDERIGEVECALGTTRLVKGRPFSQAEPSAAQRAAHSTQPRPSHRTGYDEKPTTTQPLNRATPDPLTDSALHATAETGYPDRTAAAYSDLIGGRLLAWAGGIAILLGIALFLALAISHGWIGEQARVLLAGAGSLALLAAGSWLHGRRGRTEAAVAMTGAGVAGLFATLIVASAGYHLLPALLALAGALAVGAVATVLAIRWAGRPLAGIGLVGALAAPALVGAPAQWPTLAMMLACAGFAMWVAARQRWAWLPLATVAVCAPQWAVPMLEGQSAAETLGVLVAFAALGLVGSLASARSLPSEEQERLAPAALAAIALNAIAVALVGRIALSGDPSLGDAWLAVLAGVHLAIGAAPRRLRLGARLRAVLLALGLVLADVALALSLDGLALALSWSASVVVLGAVTRGAKIDGRPAMLRDLGIGAQVSLALTRTLIEAPPSALFGGSSSEAAGPIALIALSAGCLATAHLLAERHAAARASLAGLGLAAIAYLTAFTLSGSPLVVAWAAEAGALSAFAAARKDRTARAGAALYGTAATLYTLFSVAPPSGLGGEGVELGSAAICLGSLAALAWRASRLCGPASRNRQLATVAAGAPLLYLLSLVAASLPQGQVALSALWGLSGVGALIAGLRIGSPPLRHAALALLLATIGKVFLYDLSTLTSLARVVSFLVLGTLLLAGAFAYQRLCPPPQPDMRSVHPSQR